MSVACAQSGIGQDRFIEEPSTGRTNSRMIMVRLVANLAEKGSGSIHRVVEIIVDRLTRSIEIEGLHLVAKYI